MSPSRVELRPHVLHPNRFTVSIYHNQVLTYTDVRGLEEALELAETMGKDGYQVCWNHTAGAPYRAWRQEHAAVN